MFLSESRILNLERKIERWIKYLYLSDRAEFLQVNTRNYLKNNERIGVFTQDPTHTWLVPHRYRFGSDGNKADRSRCYYPRTRNLISVPFPAPILNGDLFLSSIFVLNRERRSPRRRRFSDPEFLEEKKKKQNRYKTKINSKVEN